MWCWTCCPAVAGLCCRARLPGSVKACAGLAAGLRFAPLLGRGEVTGRVCTGRQAAAWRCACTSGGALLQNCSPHRAGQEGEGESNQIVKAGGQASKRASGRNSGEQAREEGLLTCAAAHAAPHLAATASSAARAARLTSSHLRIVSPARPLRSTGVQSRHASWVAAEAGTNERSGTWQAWGCPDAGRGDAAHVQPCPATTAAPRRPRAHLRCASCAIATPSFASAATVAAASATPAFRFKASATAPRAPPNTSCIERGEQVGMSV